MPPFPALAARVTVREGKREHPDCAANEQHQDDERREIEMAASLS